MSNTFFTREIKKILNIKTANGTREALIDLTNDRKISPEDLLVKIIYFIKDDDVVEIYSVICETLGLTITAPEEKDEEPKDFEHEQQLNDLIREQRNK